MALPAAKQEKIARCEVRCADLVKDKTDILSALEAYLGATENVKRFDWLYLAGPHGPAKCWLLIDTETQEVVGAAALFPRLVIKDGKEILGCVFGDFCLKPSWRSLGPGVQLQKACIQSLTDGTFAAGYDLPSAGMLAIYQRLGQRPASEMVRYAKPLRINRKVSERVPFPPAADVISGMGNELLKWKDALTRKRTDWTISLFEGNFGKEFDELSERCATGSTENQILRGSSYLNWRFRKHPYKRYEFFTAKNGAELGGYLILDRSEGQMSVVDAQVAVDSSALPALLEAATQLGRKTGNDSLSFSLLNDDPLTILLREMGFHPRESRPVILCGKESADTETKWRLFDGDRES